MYFYVIYNSVGIETDIDVYKAFNYYPESARMKHALGTYNLWCCFEKSGTVSRQNLDDCKAFICYKNSANINMLKEHSNWKGRTYSIHLFQT